MSVYDKIAVIVPGANIVIDPEKTFKHYHEEISEKISKGESVKFVSCDNDVAVVYTPTPGNTVIMMTEKKYEAMKRDQQLAMMRQQGLPLIKQ